MSSVVQSTSRKLINFLKSLDNQQYNQEKALKKILGSRITMTVNNWLKSNEARIQESWLLILLWFEFNSFIFGKNTTISYKSALYKKMISK